MTLLHDTRYTLRLLAKSPGFALVAVLTLAVGIGANTAIFSVMNALLLKALPYPEPDRLVLLGARKRQGASENVPLSWPRVQLISEHTRSLGSVAAFTREQFNLTGQGDPEQVPSARVSSNFFEILGVRPALGRAFVATEDKPGGDNVVTISHALWSRRFGGSSSAIGQHLTLDGKDYSVIGVLPAGFQFGFLGQTVDIYAPRVIELNIITPAQAQGGTGFLNCVARLAPGVTVGQAQAEMDALAAQYRREYPKFPDTDPSLMVHAGDLRDETVAHARPAVLILFGAVGVLLLIACANIAGLVLSRALGRKREIAVRTAMGAKRADLVRQLLTESVILALAGGMFGGLLSSWGTRILASMASGSLPRAEEISMDARVMAFTAAISVLAGLLFGLAPALQISRVDLNSVLRSEGRGTTSGRRSSLMRSTLVVAQVALSLVLLIGAGLLVRNFRQLQSASRGFDSRDLLTMNIALPPARYPQGPQMTAFYYDLVRRVRAVPGVRSAAVVSALPANPVRFSAALPAGQAEIPLSQRPLFNIVTFLPGYPGTMRTRLVTGREFTEHDDAHAPLVIMVNETLVRRYWPNENPVGKHILVGRIAQPIEVIGVLGDVPNNNLQADVQPEIYMPFAQRPWAAMNLIVRTAADPHGFVSSVRAAVLAVDRDQPVTAIQTMDEVLEKAAVQPRFTTTLLGVLAATALLMALVGIYGVLSYSVAEHTQEMGIRMALGADRVGILRMVLGQALGLAGAGITLGLGASLMLTRLLGSLLYHVSVTDPLTFTSASLVFAAVALLAGYLPARRAMRVDPAVALRWE
jgi:putative ABC transport system permease protein